MRRRGDAPPHSLFKNAAQAGILVKIRVRGVALGTVYGQIVQSVYARPNGVEIFIPRIIAHETEFSREHSLREGDRIAAPLRQYVFACLQSVSGAVRPFGKRGEVFHFVRFF